MTNIMFHLSHLPSSPSPSTPSPLSLPILRLVLQQLRLSNRLLAIIGLIMSIVATLLMGDWQAIRHDPCTDASLFHHPDLLHTYTEQLDATPHEPAGSTMSAIPGDGSIQCERLNLSISLLQQLKTSDINVFVYPNKVTGDIMTYGCERVGSCPQCSLEREDGVFSDYSATPTCLHLHINPQQHCLETVPLLPWQPKPHPLSSWYSCTMPHSLFTYCLSVLTLPGVNQTSEEIASIQCEEEEYIADVHVQSVQIVESHVDSLAAQSCHSLSDHSCHWNPNSSITHRHCEDCPPICRDHTNYLEFSQFTIAAAILLVSVPVARVPITSIISDIVSIEQQVHISYHLLHGSQCYSRIACLSLCPGNCHGTSSGS